MSPLLQFHDVHKVFGAGATEVRALESVSLTVREGEVVVAMGPSGCGKSTLLHLAGGLEPPTSGQVVTCGRNLAGVGAAEVAEVRRRHVGFVFQQLNLVPSLTAVENVMLPLELDGVRRRAAREAALAALGKVGLDGPLDRFPDDFSGGQQQRVAIVRALMTRPDVLLLDEITAALDPELVGEVLRIIRDLKDQGMTMLIVTHEMGFARDVADRVAFLDAGAILELDVPARLFTSPSEERTRRFLQRIVESGRF